MGSLRYSRGGRWRQPDEAGDGAVRRVPSFTRWRTVVVVLACALPLALALAVTRMAPVASNAPVAPVASDASPIAPVGAIAASIATAAPSTPSVAPASTATTASPAREVAPNPRVVVAPLVVAPVVAPEPPKDVTVVDKLFANEALSSALARHGCAADDTSALLGSLKGKLDLKGLRDGTSFTLLQHPTVGAASVLLAFELKTLSPEGVPRTLKASRKEPSITADDAAVSYAVSVEDAPIETKLEGVTGSVRSSLYQAMLEAGEDANLVDRFVDVFAWNIDFYRQTRAGDQWKVLVEKKYAGGRFLGYGKVLAAEYVNAGAVYRGFLFNSKDGKQSGTYDDEGSGLQRTFLKAPMEITHVTSSYGMRFHPLNHDEQFHHGIDYGAPIGTPIWTVADGVVEMAKMNGGAGNMVKIKHMNGFETEYFHMSRFADGIHQGSRVKQKQLIGYVGSTGLSTGPHLHFGMFKNGDHVDPVKQKFPNAAGVPKPYESEFKKFMAPLLEQLKSLDAA